jgi:tetratricopeptide (TPR) repeat protein
MPGANNDVKGIPMAQDSEIRTATMAKIYAAQGHYDKAAEIYRDLLQQDPRRRDLTEALAEVEKKRLEKSCESNTDLAPLFSQWVKLLLRYKQIQDLEKIKHRIVDDAHIIR